MGSRGGRGPRKTKRQKNCLRERKCKQKLKRGSTSVLGHGLAAPAPPPHACPWCRGATERLANLGQVSAPSALPWLRRSLPERRVGASATPHTHEPPLPPLSSVRTGPPSQTLCAAAHPPGTSTSRGCPSWCLEQHCRIPRCPLHDFHPGPLSAWHRVCMGCRCPNLLVPARFAGGGRGGRGGHCCRAPMAWLRPAPLHPCLRLSPAAPSRPPAGAKVGRVKGGWRLVPPPSRRLPLVPFAHHRGAVGVGESRAVPGTPSARAILRIKSGLIERAATGSTAEGGVATKGANVGGRGRGGCSCQPGPINAEHSARSGRPSPYRGAHIGP